ncbi:MAG: serine hydrolase [Lewinellaceae bacterium]|nr:serine hydrolase [Lewinellaceae bacterium]
MKHPFLIPLIPMLLALLFASCKKEEGPQIPPDTATPAELSAKLEGIIENTEVPGFAVTVAEGGAIIFQEAFGYADRVYRKPYTNQTLQHLASVSKTFVGAAVVKVLEQGYFTLETDINDILPVELSNPKLPDAVIRVKHLVTHTSGLLDNPAVYVAENYYIMRGKALPPSALRYYTSVGIEQQHRPPLEEFLVSITSKMERCTARTISRTPLPAPLGLTPM